MRRRRIKKMKKRSVPTEAQAVFCPMFFRAVFPNRQDILSVAALIAHIVHLLFDHVDAEAADLPLLRRERHVRVGPFELVVGDAGVDQRNDRRAVPDRGMDLRPAVSLRVSVVRDIDKQLLQGYLNELLRRRRTAVSFQHGVYEALHLVEPVCACRDLQHSFLAHASPFPADRPPRPLTGC